MKYLKLFEGFNREDIKSICRKYKIENYTINEDGTIDVEGDVNLHSKGLTKIPLKFRNVSGDFWCSLNQLTTLEGSPKEVGRDFSCRYNKLTSLEGSPKEVGGYFSCHNNKLTSLEGSPKTVGDHFSCQNNKLTSLEGCTKSVGGNFSCDNNKLKTLEGIGKVSGDIYCGRNPCISIYYEWINTDRRDELLDLMEDYDFLRGDEIYWERLESFYSDSGLKIPNRVELEKYYTIIE